MGVPGEIEGSQVSMKYEMYRSRMDPRETSNGKEFVFKGSAEEVY